jgi:hypothetical protein
MTPEVLSAKLAQRVFGWRVTPGRFIVEGRSWKPAWRFRPMERLEDAFSLLDATDATEYCISRRGGMVRVRVMVRGSVGAACDSSTPRAISVAVARAVGIEVPDQFDAKEER